MRWVAGDRRGGRVEVGREPRLHPADGGAESSSQGGGEVVLEEDEGVVFLVAVVDHGPTEPPEERRPREEVQAHHVHGVGTPASDAPDGEGAAGHPPKPAAANRKVVHGHSVLMAGREIGLRNDPHRVAGLREAGGQPIVVPGMVRHAAALNDQHRLGAARGRAFVVASAHLASWLTSSR